MRFEVSNQIIYNILGLLIFSCLSSSIALRCWQCRGQITVRELQRLTKEGLNAFECGDPFNSSLSATLDDCESRGSGLHQAWCRKTIQRSNNIIMFSRDCDLNYEDLNENELGTRNGRQNSFFVAEPTRCTSQADPNGDFTDDCRCRGRDGCNSFGTDLSLVLRTNSSSRLNYNNILITIIFLNIGLTLYLLSS